MQGGSPAQNDGQALAAKTIKYEELVNFKKTTTKNPTKQEKKIIRKCRLLFQDGAAVPLQNLNPLGPLPAWVEEWCAWYFYISLYTAHRK